MARIDLTGKTFGRLTVLAPAGKNDKGAILWRCKCECGNEAEVRGDALRRGFTKSCGCLAHEARVRLGSSSAGRASKKRLDLAGKTFGRLTVLKAVPRYKKPLQWRCRCECGKETLVVTSKLTSGQTHSCGCLGLENATKAKIKHGGAHTPLYNVWNSMKERCSNPNVRDFKYYGGKGVSVCTEWMKFDGFQSWARSNGYAKGLTIDRIDPDGDYCPENCRWITAQENYGRAHRKSEDIRERAFALVDGGMPIPAAARSVGIAPITLYTWRKNAAR